MHAALNTRGGRARPILVATFVVALFAADSLDAETLYYKQEGGTIVFTNVRGDGLRPVPGFSGRRQIRSATPLPATAYDRYIEYLAKQTGVSGDLIKAVAMVESGFDPHAVSPKGALGLMQLMPAVARQYGVKNPYDPHQNLRGGATHLGSLLDRYDGDLRLALAAYNAGSGAVKRYRGVPPYRETRNYIRKVNALLGGRPATNGAASRGRPAPPSSAPVRVVYAADGTISLVN